jgi:hypothetical protein
MFNLNCLRPGDTATVNVEKTSEVEAFSKTCLALAYGVLVRCPGPLMCRIKQFDGCSNTILGPVSPKFTRTVSTQGANLSLNIVPLDVGLCGVPVGEILAHAEETDDTSFKFKMRQPPNTNGTTQVFK